ncbi:MAG: tetratricopeptide repeat protein [Thermodesulfobacteriota bacterium]
MPEKPAKVATEHLNRAKAAYLKGEALKPLVSVAEAVKVMATSAIHSMDLGPVATLLRELLGSLSKDEKIKQFAPGPFSYVKGQEKQLYNALASTARKLKEEMDRETLEAMRERKLKIDRAIIAGQRLLDHGNTPEAQRSFREAVEMHVDEDAMFLIIPEKLQKAGCFRESLEYLKRALKINPGERRACEMAAEAYEQAQDPAAGAALFTDLLAKGADGPHPHLALARLNLAAKKLPEAAAALKKCLELEPGLPDAKRLASQIKRAAAKAKA